MPIHISRHVARILGVYSLLECPGDESLATSTEVIEPAKRRSYRLGRVSGLVSV